MKSICIDPGHGGIDSGAVGFNLQEKDVVLNISKILKTLLQSIGLKVYMTREDDRFVELKDRCLIANQLKADLFISIHCNSADNKSAFGFEIYHAKGSKQGEQLSSHIRKAINENKVIIRADRGIKTAQFRVLIGTDMPSVLIETAFISNMYDNMILQQKQKEIAKAIYKGICNYLGISVGKLILEKPTATIQQMKQWAMTKTKNNEFIDLADVYYKFSIQRGINPAISYAQFAHETGFLYETPSMAGLDKTYHNPCGLKIAQGGGDYDKNAHMRFNSWEDGISAHLDHLALYAGAKGYPKKNTLDTRHFDYLLGTARTVEQLSEKWAPSKDYADKVLKYVKEIEQMKVDNTQPSKWAKDLWEKGKELKLTDGTRPHDQVTRQELVAGLVRLYELVDKK